MNKTTQTELDINLYFGNYNGSMTVEIKNNNQTLTKFANAAAGEYNVKCLIDMPANLTFTISGKNYNTDTQVVDQEIVADKFVQLKSMSLGKIPIGVLLLPTICKFTTDKEGDKIKYETYWGFNGVVDINIPYSNFIKYHLSMNNGFDRDGLKHIDKLLH